MQGEESQPKVAERFGVSLSFVRDLSRRVRESGSVASKPHGGGRPPLSEALCQRLRAVVAQKPDATLAEYCALLRKRRYGGAHISPWALSRVLRRRLRLTRKKERPSFERTRPKARAAPARRLAGKD